MKTVTLRPITLSDTDDIVRWRNSDAVRFNMQDQRMLNAEQHRNYYHTQIETRKIVQYIIIAGSSAIGTVYYKVISPTIVEIGLFIGEGEYRNKGYGSQTMTLILREIKKNEKYKRAVVKVKRENGRGARLYKRFGFVTSSNDGEGSFICMEKVLRHEV